MVERLLVLAEALAQDAKGSATVRRRAVSTAYYAVFHALARLCAGAVAGEASRNDPYYEKVYRSLDHGPLRTVFAKEPIRNVPALRIIGDIVVPLQSERHRSDYLPGRSLYTDAQCRLHIESAKTAVDLIARLGTVDRRALVISLLFKERNL